MSDGTDRHREQVLALTLSDSATMSIRCLAAAERAVLDGRFNIAKVLRACAHSSRLTALTAARLLTQNARPAETLAMALALLQQQSRDASPSVLEDILRRALGSLESNRDVLESDVAQSLWGCQVCGAVVEGSAPERCSLCGALRFEFDWFGPFYSGTVERLGRRSPREIAAILTDSPRRLASLLDGIDEERLATRPSADEWCIKEIAGHLIDVTQLFCWRVRTIRDAVAAASLAGPVPPWRLLDGKRYGDVASRLLVEGFGVATQEALDIIQDLGADDWGRFGLIRGRVVTTILDLGTWLVNHNVAHCAQIEALREITRR